MAFRSRLGTHRHEARLLERTAGNPENAGAKRGAAHTRIYPPRAPLATARALRLNFVFDFARRLDDDPPGVEVDRRGDPAGERQEQRFAAAGWRDLEDVAAAIVHD